MSRLSSVIVRISAFFRKEMVEIIRQPRLVLTLVLGPFLILLLFGLGYRNQARAVSAIFVTAPNSELRQNIEQFATTLGEHLIFAGITTDAQAAIDALARGAVDMVVVPPADVEGLIRNNEQAVFTLYHNEIDPAQVSYIEYLGRNYIDEVNRRVLSTFAEEAQEDTSNITPEIRAARDEARAMREALAAGDVTSARSHQQNMNSSIGSILTSVETKMIFAQAVQSSVGVSGQNSDLGGVLDSLASLQTDSENDQPISENSSSFGPEIQRLTETEQKLDELDTQLTEFQSISPTVLVSPFRSETKSIAPLQQIEPAIFFAPAVIALLLQHMAVTFGALSIVRERLSGTMDLFRVAPVSAFETLFGKYISYMVLGSLLSGILMALLYFILKVPFLGGWVNVALITLALLFVSMGVGFVISLLAENESQAVQLAMITLLVSVFFSGMFLDLRYLWTPVQTISWLTPATYGRLLYQDVMLRGYGITPLYILGLIFIGLFLFLLSLKILRKEMKLG